MASRSSLIPEAHYSHLIGDDEKIRDLFNREIEAVAVEINIEDIFPLQGATKQNRLRQRLSELLSSSPRVVTGPDGGNRPNSANTAIPPSSSSAEPVRLNKHNESVISPMEKALEKNVDGLSMRISSECAMGDGVRARSQAAGKNICATHCSVKGARSSNEDFHRQRITEFYAISIVCDGHGGSQALSPTASPLELVQSLQGCFKQAFQEVDTQTLGDSEGSTLSALILQAATNMAANIPVLLMSDENVTLNVLLVTSAEA